MKEKSANLEEKFKSSIKENAKNKKVHKKRTFNYICIG